jgi:hypothetical protein
MALPFFHPNNFPQKLHTALLALRHRAWENATFPDHTASIQNNPDRIFLNISNSNFAIYGMFSKAIPLDLKSEMQKCGRISLLQFHINSKADNQPSSVRGSHTSLHLLNDVDFRCRCELRSVQWSIKVLSSIFSFLKRKHHFSGRRYEELRISQTLNNQN